MKRFYKTAAPAPADTGWQVLLDGRGIKTAMGAQQVVPGQTLANALADEWAAQGEEIDPAGFVFRDLAEMLTPGRLPRGEALLLVGVDHPELVAAVAASGAPAAKK